MFLPRLTCNVSKVVLSTDKAAYPINSMGMSKALMEKVMVAKSRSISTFYYPLWNEVW